MSLRGRAVLVAEGQSGKRADSELEGSLLPRGRQRQVQSRQDGKYHLDKSKVDSYPCCLASQESTFFRSGQRSRAWSSPVSHASRLLFCSSLAPLHVGHRDSLTLGSMITDSSLQTRWWPDGVEGALSLLGSKPGF